MKQLSSILYPFSALVGQEEMQLALLLNAVNPAIGGLLIRGEKGTAKSTAARALAALLPRGDRTDFHFEMQSGDGVQSIAMPLALAASRFVELPVGASDDRVIGTLDIERALTAGERHFEPGLLARAHGGILYVDEVNLLPDHIVDVLLDVSASGVNTVERESVSVTHPARFILIGTMNPEEGELRPQLLDRFGLAVDVAGPKDPAIRAEVVRRRFAFEANAAAFTEQYREQDQALMLRILMAQEQLEHIKVSDGLLELITQICVQSGVDGLRADITMYKTARTLAAWEGRANVVVDDVRRAAQFVLPHRRRRQPFEEPGLDREQLDDLIQQNKAPVEQSRAQGEHGEREKGEEQSPKSSMEGD